MKTMNVRLGDIIPHETPDPDTVQSLVVLLRAGFLIPNIEIDPEQREHFTQGPRGMESTGFGHGLLDGHHRHAALLAIHGPDHVIEVNAWEPIPNTHPGMDA